MTKNLSVFCQTRSGPNILKTPKNSQCHLELLEISQFFAILSRNANAEPVFSLTQAQWT